MGDYAWVTLATNDTYSLGALVLAHSLRNVGTSHQLVVMVTPGVTTHMREKLASVFNVIFEVNILDSKDEANLLLLQRPELGVTFTKLHCWRLTQFKKCLFLDADTLVLQKCDELFEREELSAAPDVGWPDCFNSGVFVYRPSEATYDSLVRFALEKGSFDGGDQGLLNLYFSDWAHKDISKHLPFIYNMCSTAGYSYLPAFKQFGDQVKIIHFIGASKPWLQYFNTETMEVQSAPGFEHLKKVFEHWWNIFCANVHYTLSPTMARINTAIASCTSPSLLPLHNNETIHQNEHCAEVLFDTHTNNLPPWDPWEDYPRQTDPLQNEEQITVQFIPTQQHAHSNSQINVVHQYHSNSGTVIDHRTVIDNQCTNLITESCQDSPSSSSSSYINPVASSTIDRSVQETEPVTVEYAHTNDYPSNVPIQCTSTLDTHPPEPFNSQTAVYKCKSASPIATDQSSFTDSHSGSTEAHVDENGGLAGAFAQMTLGQPRSPTQSALEEHMRRQGWEVGRIDYLGQDSFDNIWKKICQTLSESAQKQPSPPKEIAPVAIEPTLVVAAEPTPVVAAEPTSVVAAETTPVIAAEPSPVVAAEPSPVVAAEATPVVAAEATPVVAAEPTPVVAAKPTPVVAADPSPTVAMESTPVVVEEPTPVVAEEPTPVVATQSTPVVAAEPTPVVVADPTPVIAAEPASIVDTKSTSVVATEPTLIVATEPAPAAPTETTPAAPTPVVAAEPTPTASVESTPGATAESTPVATAELTLAAAAEPTSVVAAESTPAAPVESTTVVSADLAPITPAEKSVSPSECSPKVPTEALVPPTTVVPIEGTIKTKGDDVPTAVVKSSKAPPSTESPKVTKAGAGSAPKTTEKAKTVDKSPSTTSAEKESVQQTPTPPPRKGSKNGGASSKKATKKK